MRFPYSAAGKPFLPLAPTLGAQTVSTEGLVDSGSDVNVVALERWKRLGGNVGLRKATLRLGGTLAGTPAMPLLVMAKVAGFAPVRLAFAWCRTDEVPLVLGQTNFFMEFDVCFFRSRSEFSVVPKGAGPTPE